MSVAGHVFALLWNTARFDWNSLRECRNMFLVARSKEDRNRFALVIELLTVMAPEGGRVIAIAIA